MRYLSEKCPCLCISFIADADQNVRLFPHKLVVVVCCRLVHLNIVLQKPSLVFGTGRVCSPLSSPERKLCQKWDGWDKIEPSGLFVPRFRRKKTHVHIVWKDGEVQLPLKNIHGTLLGFYSPESVLLYIYPLPQT